MDGRGRRRTSQRSSGSQLRPSVAGEALLCRVGSEGLAWLRGAVEAPGRTCGLFDGRERHTPASIRWHRHQCRWPSTCRPCARRSPAHGTPCGCGGQERWTVRGTWRRYLSCRFLTWHRKKRLDGAEDGGSGGGGGRGDRFGELPCAPLVLPPQPPSASRRSAKRTRRRSD